VKEVTDPTLLAQLETQNKEVTDPALLAQLEGKEENAIVETVKNIPRSAANYVGNIVSAVVNPADTVRGVASVASGNIQMTPETVQNSLFGMASANPVTALPAQIFRKSMRPEDVEVSKAVGGFYKDRYGGFSNIRKTIIEDPVGAVADASAVLGLAGSALRAAGLSNAANVANTASKFTDPLYLTSKAVKTVAKPIYRQAVGQTTGAGARVIDEALKGSDEFVDAMRGNTTEGQIVDTAKDALDDIRQARGNEYRVRLQNLKGVTKQIDINDIKILADDQLDRYNVAKTPSGLDFSRSSASGSSAREIEEVYKMVQDWGSQTGDLTPAMLDILKRRLDDFYAEGRTSRAMVTSLKKAVQNKLVSAVPEYADMTKDYAKTTEVIKEMERAVGLGDKTAADTAIRKLTMALREDKNFRADLLKALENSTGENVTGAVAGSVMKPMATRSLGSMVAGGFGIAGLATMSPALAALLPLASPRVVGELSVLLGKLSRQAPKVRVPAQAAFQAGRINEETKAP
jgi:hypothetical protein